MKYILTLDQGTTGSAVSLISSSGHIVAQHDEEFRQIFPQEGWVEHNPEDIWESIENGIKSCLKKAKIAPEALAGIGITNQRETVVAWDKMTGKPLANAIVWQCRRTAAYCESLKKRGLEGKIKKKTGLVLDPYFSATKMHWLLKNVPAVKEAAKAKRLAFGTIDSFLVFRLSGGASHITDVSNASRTLLMNLTTLQYDDELLKIFGLNKDHLAKIVDSSGPLAEVKKHRVLPNGLWISGIAGDQQAALFGQACFKPGESKITFGTGSFLLLNTGDKPFFSKQGLLTTVAWRLPGKKAQYAIEGGAFVCGAAVQWLRDQLEMFESSREVEDLAHAAGSAEGVEVVPAFSGFGAPLWNPGARAMISGLSRGSNKGNISYAVLEAMALQNVDILLAMKKDLKKPIRKVRVDGGASANQLLMQMQSDYLQVKVERPKNIETTTMGAAFLAGLGVGLWKSLSEIQKLSDVEKEFKPKIKNSAAKARHNRWLTTIKAVTLLSR